MKPLSDEVKAILETAEVSGDWTPVRDRCGTGPYAPRGTNRLEFRSGPQCGVYFLIARKIVVYVGSSKNILARIGVHCERIEFDSVRWISVGMEALHRVEADWILKLKPRENGFADYRGVRRYCEPRHERS